MTKEQFTNKIKIICKNIWDFFVVKTKTHFFDILILSFIVAISFLFFNHYDTSVTTIHGVKLLELTFSGRFFDFYAEVNRPWFEGPGYDYSLISSVPMNEQWRYCPAVYPIITYILYGFLNLPFYLFGLLFSIEVDTIFYMTMNKFATAIALFVTYIFIKKIVAIFIEKIDGKNILLTFFSSAILIFSAFIFNQLDSFYTLLLIIGLYYVLKHKYWQGFLLMGFGCCFKYLPLLICFPIVLLHHKKPWPILKYTLILLAPSAFFYLLFFNNPGYKMTSAITDFNTQFFASYIYVGGSSIYLLFIFEFIGIAFAYIYKIKENDKGLSTLYFSVFFASVFSVFLQWNPQWMLMVVPFFTLILCVSKRKFVSTVGLSIFELGYILYILTRFTFNVGDFMVEQGLIAQLVNKQYYFTNNFANKLALLFGNQFNYQAISYTILTIGASIILIVNFKQFLKDCSVTDVGNGTPRYSSYLRMMVIFLYLLPNLNHFFHDPGAKISKEEYTTQFNVTYDLNWVSAADSRIVIKGYAFETSKLPYGLTNQVMLVDSVESTQYVLDTTQSINTSYANTKYYGTGFVVDMNCKKVPYGDYRLCLLTTNNGTTSLVETGVMFYVRY